MEILSDNSICSVLRLLPVNTRARARALAWGSLSRGAGGRPRATLCPHSTCTLWDCCSLPVHPPAPRPGNFTAITLKRDRRGGCWLVWLVQMCVVLCKLAYLCLSVVSVFFLLAVTFDSLCCSVRHSPPPYPLLTHFPRDNTSVMLHFYHFPWKEADRTF